LLSDFEVVLFSPDNNGELTFKKGSYSVVVIPASFYPPPAGANGRGGEEEGKKSPEGWKERDPSSTIAPEGKKEERTPTCQVATKARPLVRRLRPPRGKAFTPHREPVVKIQSTPGREWKKTAQS